ncbi:MAG: rod shape-determining protein MreD [Cellulosilyticaceae bacterium]
MRITILSILLVAIHILETTIFQNIRIGGIAPNFTIMIIVSFALLRGCKEGTIIGMLAGLLHDVSFSSTIGLTVITYALIGYGCGKFNKDFYRENFIIPFFCTLGSSLFASAVTMISFILYGKVRILFFLKSIIIPELIYTVTLSLVVYQLMYIINEKIEEHEKKTRNIF